MFFQLVDAAVANASKENVRPKKLHMSNQTVENPAAKVPPVLRNEPPSSISAQNATSAPVVAEATTSFPVTNSITLSAALPTDDHTGTIISSILQTSNILTPISPTISSILPTTMASSMVVNQSSSLESMPTTTLKTSSPTGTSATILDQRPGQSSFNGNKVVLGVFFGAIIVGVFIIYIIRKTKLRPSRNFKKRMDPNYNSALDKPSPAPIAPSSVGTKPTYTTYGAVKPLELGNQFIRQQHEYEFAYPIDQGFYGNNQPPMPMENVIYQNNHSGPYSNIGAHQYQQGSNISARHPINHNGTNEQVSNLNYSNNRSEFRASEIAERAVKYNDSRSEFSYSVISHDSFGSESKSQRSENASTLARTNVP